MIALTVLAAWLFADFMSGLGHWAQDKLLTKETRFKFLNQIKFDNDLHHSHPLGILKFSYWETMRIPIALSWPMALFLFLVNAHPVFPLAFFFLGFANTVHRFAHAAPVKLPAVVRLLQRSGIFLSRNNHHAHHYAGRKKIVRKEDATKNFCVMSDFLNPILDITFFPILEAVWRRFR